MVPSEAADQAVMELHAVEKVPHRHGKQPVEPRPLADLFHPDARKSGPALARCQAGGEDFLDFEPAAPNFDAGPGEDHKSLGMMKFRGRKK